MFDARVASYDENAWNASPTAKLIGGVAMPLLLGMASWKLSQLGSRALAPKLSMRKMVQIDPKLAWAAAGAKSLASLPYLINGSCFVLNYTDCFRIHAGHPGHPYAAPAQVSSLGGSTQPARHKVKVSLSWRAQIFVNWDAVRIFCQDLKTVSPGKSVGQHLQGRLSSGYSEAKDKLQRIAREYLKSCGKLTLDLIKI